MTTRGVVLTYHSQNCGGHGYSTNDHIAFANDLEMVHSFGLPLVPLETVALAYKQGKVDSLPHRFVALTCDDGTTLDWHDYNHPRFGPQRSFANILRDHSTRIGPLAPGILTAFVIASEEARTAIDAGCYDGLPLSDDHWWKLGAADGIISIQNHSWDHLHPVLPDEILRGRIAGDFYSVTKFEEADLQVCKAGDTIRRILGDLAPATSLFAYPFGHASAYLWEYYFPVYENRHRVKAAFTTEQGFLYTDTPRFKMPRMVFGDAWSSPAQFSQMLEDLLAD